MSDGSRNGAIEDQTFLRKAVTKPGYQLLDLGSYPGLVRVEQDGRQIEGELWEVHKSRIDLLDQIEGAPVLYRMENVDIEGEERLVQTYFFKYKIQTSKAPVIENNRWENKKN